jgi:hypothetical protein
MSTWISANETLSDDDTTVLLYAPDGFDPVFVGSKDGDSWIDDNGLEYRADQVTHWMQLPDPPEVER